MVSSLWKACADGDASRVDELLKDASSVDIEIKDHTGVTPLIQAVKGSHVQVVKALLARGADPTNASAQGRPETYTSDPHVLAVLAAARGEPVMAYPDPAQAQYYPYPYPHYPPYPDPVSPYYPAPPQQTPQEGEHAANLPPPEVARNIPCRYYPACRYGSACIFAHPQAPYFPGPLPPPAHYAPHPPNPPLPLPQPYDPSMAPPGAYPYYPVSPPFNPVSPSGPPPGHMRAHSEILSPPPFSPQHLPVPMQYMPPPPPPQPTSPPFHVPYPPPPPSAYARRASVTSLASYPSPVALDPTHGPPAPKSPEAQGAGRPRRGSAGFRDGRPPYTGRKPPCLFFPSGRCRNGDECRFPHVIPEGGAPPPLSATRTHFPPRSRAGTGYYGSRDSVGSGSRYGTIEEKLAGLTVRDNAAPRDTTPRDTGGTNTPSSTKPAATSTHPNGKRAVPAPAPPKPQRIPSADDFPVLRAATPPTNGQAQPNGHAHANGNGGATGNGHANGWVNAVNGTGPTAAQLLREKDAAASRGPSPRPAAAPVKDAKPQPQANGSAPENLAKPVEVQVSA